LRTALHTVRGVDDVSVVAVVDEPVDDPLSENHDGVLARVEQGARGDYVRAARLLGRLDIDVVLLQHEYGIFGGEDGEYVLSFAEELQQPLVATLHTVLSRPSPHQLEVVRRLGERAELVIVMTETARRLLLQAEACPAGKIRVVPHGAPIQLVRRRAELANGGRPLHYTAASSSDNGGSARRLTTFGLISPGKGLETAIGALPAILEGHANVRYVVAGRTHPEVARRDGEQYRLLLERRVAELGLGEYVEFDDRFLSLDELADLLAATDVFVTPYRNREQIASGALTFAVAAGCAAVSTPYWYAQDLLSSGAGRLVPFGDEKALADAVREYLDHPQALASAQAEAGRLGTTLAWPAVARATTSVLREAAVMGAPRPVAPGAVLELAHVRRDHLLALTDDVAIVQHASGVIPNRSTGYCVDDTARLVIVALELASREKESGWERVLLRALSFLQSACDHAGRGMHNFMSYERRWLDEPHVGDHVGRSIWAVGEVLARATSPAILVPCRELLAALVTYIDDEVYLRTAAYALLGLARSPSDDAVRSRRGLSEHLVDRLAAAYAAHSSSEWRWFEDRLSYDNARLAHALVAGAESLGRAAQVSVGLESLRWLGDECGLAEGILRLPGHLGRDRGEAAPGGGDEQPLDACALVEAELVAFSITGDPEHRVRAQHAFDWFVGRNRLEQPLYDFASGGCRDGLGATEPNVNQGAESTLAFHHAELLLDAAELPLARRGHELQTRAA
jgi:glycosyltransferase involved in cell wall biosynthesis